MDSQRYHPALPAGYLAPLPDGRQEQRIYMPTVEGGTALNTMLVGCGHCVPPLEFLYLGADVPLKVRGCPACSTIFLWRNGGAA